MKGRDWLISLLVGALVASGSAVAADKVVEMAPVSVVSVQTSIRLRPTVNDSSGHPRVVSLAIEHVRKDSPADQAGLKAGMELTAINGVRIQGLEPAELDKVWRGPFLEDVLVLKVVTPRKGAPAFPSTIRIPLQKPAAVKSRVEVRIGNEVVNPPPAATTAP